MELLTQRLSIQLLILEIFCNFGQATAGEALTKTKAFETMKNNSFKWKETSLLDDDAKAKLDLAASQYYPVVTASLREFGGRLEPIQFGLIDSTVSWFTAGQSAIQVYYSLFEMPRSDRYKAAESYQKRNSAQRDSYRNDLTFLMISQFLNVQRLQKRLLILETGPHRGEELKKIAEIRVASGNGVKLDLLHAQSVVEFENMKRLELQSAYNKAVHLLALTLGQENVVYEVEPLRAIAFSIPEAAKEIIDSNVQARFDIQSLKHLAVVRQSLTESISHERWPKVNLLGDAGVLGATSPFGLGKDFNGTIGFQVSVPILNLSINAREAQSRAESTKAELESQSAEFEARAEVRQAIEQISQTQKTLEVSNHQLITAEEELKISTEKFSAGSMSGFEYSAARTSFLEAQSANIEVIYMYELSKAYYFKTISKFETYFELEGRKGKT